MFVDNPHMNASLHCATPEGTNCQGSMSQGFPRLMVATEFPPNGSGGGAAIVRQMLKGWPADRLFWWSRAADSDQRFGQKVSLHSAAKIPSKLVPHYKFPRAKTWLLERLWEPWAARHLKRTILKWRPDVVWSIPHAWSIAPMAACLPSGSTGFHVSIHDYADDRRAVLALGEKRCSKLATLADCLYSTATTRDAICEAMVSDLKARTGAGGSVSHAGLEPEDFEYLERRTDLPQEAVRIAFVGSITTEPTFQLFVQALETVRKSFPRLITLEIFSAHPYSARPWFNPSWMNERGNLAEPHFTKALRECSWGFAPMTLAEDDPRYRFSFSTKFISYIAAGLPVFTLGHEGTGVVQMARKYDVGLCLTSGDAKHVREKLLTALSLPNPWAVFGSEISRCAHSEFDAGKLRERLHEQFNVCARKTTAGKG